MYVELLVGNESGTKVYQPVVQEGIEWSTERKNTPGKLVFKVLYDNILDFSEGSPVRMKVDGDNVFFGFVFKQQRTKDKIITVTAYDQLRYLKNKDTKVYEGKTANQFVKMIADDYALNLGTLDDTGYVIESRVEENTSLFEMIANALDLTLTNTGEMYVLYDDFGKLTLKSASPVSIEVKTTVTFEEGHNWSNTKAAIAEAVDAYFLELRKNWSETSQTIVRVSQIENRILGVDGVVDVTGTKLNGTASNMTLTEFCIPKLGGVSA